MIWVQATHQQKLSWYERVIIRRLTLFSDIADSTAVPFAQTNSSPIDTHECFPDPPESPPPSPTTESLSATFACINGMESGPVAVEIDTTSVGLEPVAKLISPVSHTSSSDIVSPVEVSPPAMSESVDSVDVPNPPSESDYGQSGLKTDPVELLRTDDSMVVGGIHNGSPMVQCVVAAQKDVVPTTDNSEIIGGFHKGQPLVQSIVADKINEIPSVIASEEVEVIGGLHNGLPGVPSVITEDTSPNEVATTVSEMIIGASDSNETSAELPSVFISSMTAETKTIVNGPTELNAESPVTHETHIDIVVTEVPKDIPTSPDSINGESQMQTPSVESELSKEITTPSEGSADVVTVIQQVSAEVIPVSISMSTEVETLPEEKIVENSEVPEATATPPAPASQPESVDVKPTDSIPMIDEGAEEVKPVENQGIKEASEVPPPETPSKISQNRRAKWSQQIRKRCQIL